MNIDVLKPLPDGTITEARKIAEEWLKDRENIKWPKGGLPKNPPLAGDLNPTETLIPMMDKSPRILGTAEAMGNHELPKVETASEIINAPSALDIQVAGNHYRSLAIQPVEYIVKNKLGFLEGNIIKYATRYREKGGAEDIRKIIHYAQLILELEYDQ